MAAVLRSDVIAELAENASARAFELGAMIVPAERTPGHLIHVPFALLPRKMPRSAFDKAMQLAQPFNRLVHAVSQQPEWLIGTLERAGVGDDFTGRLLNIYKTVLREGIRQPLVCAVHRSDYMVDRGVDGTGAPRLLQVELNTVSSGFAALALRVADMHRYVMANHAPRYPELLEFMGAATAGDVPAVIERCMPSSHSLDVVPAAFAAAHKLYGVPTAVIAFVVQAKERNIMDQRQMEHAVWERHGIRSRRVTNEYVAKWATLSNDGALLLPREHMDLSAAAPGGGARSAADCDEVALVYYRSGYTPTDYTCEEDWQARLLMERSRAVKCPNIAYHLVGAKKVQQALALPGAVERFTSAADASLLRSCFAGLWSLDEHEADDDAEAAIADAIARPHLYVVKPQREGGGNNIYGDAVRVALTGGMTKEALAAHILMGRIFPRASDCVLVKDGASTVASAVSEMGIYSVYVADNTTEHVSDVAGFLVRTKGADVDEGGVAAGFAVIDSPFLVDDE